MAPASQTSPLRDLSERQVLGLLNGKASLRRLKLHNLPCTLDNLIALKDCTQLAANELGITAKLALVSGLQALGYPVPEESDAATRESFAKRVNHTIDYMSKSLKRKSSRDKKRIRFEDCQLHKLEQSITPDSRPASWVDHRKDLEAQTARAEARREKDNACRDTQDKLEKVGAHAVRLAETVRNTALELQAAKRTLVEQAFTFDKLEALSMKRQAELDKKVCLRFESTSVRCLHPLEGNSC